MVGILIPPNCRRSMLVQPVPTLCLPELATLLLRHVQREMQSTGSFQATRTGLRGSGAPRSTTYADTSRSPSRQSHHYSIEGRLPSRALRLVCLTARANHLLRATMLSSVSWRPVYHQLGPVNAALRVCYTSTLPAFHTLTSSHFQSLTFPLFRTSAFTNANPFT